MGNNIVVSNETNFGNFGTKDFTMQFWVSLESLGTGQYLLTKRSICSHDNFYVIHVYPDGRVGLELDFDSSGSHHHFLPSVSNLVPGKWAMKTWTRQAGKIAQEEMAKQKEAEEKKALEGTFDKPLRAEIRSDESILGPKDAPITLVEYSDFECPFCARGFGTVKELMKKYEGKIRFVYKHLPLSFHPQAMISAKYYEAIRLQDEKKAFAFHDEIYKSQEKLSSGTSFLDTAAKKVGADLKRLKKDLDSAQVAKRIDEDQKEAASLGMQGTPGFLLNGVPVRGAYPTEHFVGIIDELQKR